MTVSRTRREVLRQAIRLPAAGFAVGWLAACGDKGSVCYDAATASDKDMRAKFHYVEKSADASKVCGGCAFFSGGSTGCGTCPVFGGGPANSGGHCDSWAARV